MRHWFPVALLVMAVPSAMAGLCDDGTAPPYACSTAITGVTFDCALALREADGSDLWPVTWHDDGHLYGAFGDGRGWQPGDHHLGLPDNVVFGSGGWSYGFTRIEGTPVFGDLDVDPVTWKAFDVKAWVEGPKHGKIGATLSIDGMIYAEVNLQEDANPDVTMAYWDPDAPDDFVFCPTMWPNGAGLFQPSTIANRGQNYQGNDGFIYLYGAPWSAADRIYLARTAVLTHANAAGICDITRYEYVSGPDANGDGIFDGGTPTWSANEPDKVAVFRDGNGVQSTGLSSIVWSDGLDRYVLTSGHTAVGQLGLFEAPTPWGPWKTIHYFDSFCSLVTTADTTLGHHLPTKWMSADGTQFLMIWTSFGVEGYDAFNLVEGNFTLGAAASQPPLTPSMNPTASITTQSATLTSTTFADPDPGDVHAFSEWWLDLAGGDFSAPVAASGVSTDLTSWSVLGLLPSTSYVGRVRHRDSTGTWSGWSLPGGAFTTDVAQTSSLPAPTNLRRTDTDTDNDGLSDECETNAICLDPLDPSDALLDPDGDGVSSLDECAAGSDPCQV